MKLYLDTETVGLCGPLKTIQFAIDDGPVQIARIWSNQDYDKRFMEALWNLLYDPGTVFIGFNVGFDLFHLYRLRHELWGEWADSPRRVAKPFACQTLDLQVHAMLKSPLAPFAFSRNRSRSIARVRRIPKQSMEIVGSRVMDTLKPLIPKHFGLHMGVHRVDGSRDLVTLSFTVEGSLTLKGLMKEYGIPTIPIEDVWPLPQRESEKPWLPYPDPVVHGPVEAQCEEVMRNPASGFWKYAELDIHYLRVLEAKLGFPQPDHHSECAHAVAYTRYHGFPVDRPVLDRSITHYTEVVETLKRKLAHIDLNSPVQRLAALRALDPLVGASNKRVLKALAESERPCAGLARDIMEFGPAQQRLNQLLKVAECRTGRAHPDLRVMGTATGRMAGTSGLNWQGIGPADLVASNPTFEDEEVDDADEADTADAEPGTPESDIAAEREDTPMETVGLRAALLTPCVGDFASFEVTIAAAVYGDVQLQADLDAGVDLHSMVSVSAHPDALKRKIGYDEFVKLYKAHDPWAVGIRKRMKGIVFGVFYFCSPQKVAETLNVSVKEGEKVLEGMYGRYPGIGKYRADTERAFITADTERWAGESVGRMERERTDLVGFRRAWHFEALVADSLWRLGGRGIKTGLPGSVIRQREKGNQTVDNAVRSALLGSAIAIQAAVCRQAGNMPIQATGANLCKMLMAQCWKELRVPILVVHDECVYGEGTDLDKLAGIIKEFEEKYRKVVPSLRFDWHPTKNWAEK